MSSREWPDQPQPAAAAPADAHPGIPALRRYEYVPLGSGGAERQFAPPPRAHLPPRVTRPDPRPPLLRRLLPYAAVIWGGVSIIRFLTSFLSNDPYYRFGQFLGFGLDIALVVTGSKEIASHHLQKSRALPWLMGLLAALLIVAIVGTLVLRQP